MCLTIWSFIVKLQSPSLLPPLPFLSPQNRKLCHRRAHSLSFDHVNSAQFTIGVSSFSQPHSRVLAVDVSQHFWIHVKPCDAFQEIHKDLSSHIPDRSRPNRAIVHSTTTKRFVTPDVCPFCLFPRTTRQRSQSPGCIRHHFPPPPPPTTEENPPYTSSQPTAKNISEERENRKYTNLGFR